MDPIGRDYFSENFEAKENKIKMKNIVPRYFYLFIRVKI